MSEPLYVGKSVWIVTPDGSVTPSFVGSLDGDLAVFATIPRPCCGHVSEAHETPEAAWLHLARKSRLFAAHYTREAESVALPAALPFDAEQERWNGQGCGKVK